MGARSALCQSEITTKLEAEYVIVTSHLLRCVVCRAAFDFAAGEAALLLQHVAYGCDFVHDGTCAAAAAESIFPEPGFDCAAFARAPERRRVLSSASADG
jgi:hypothetical protein